MTVRSIGWRTDLWLRELEGAHIHEHEDHLVIETPGNREYWWGNFLLFASPPGPGDSERWLSSFAEAFPEAEHVAIGVDSTSGDLGMADGLLAAGLERTTLTVLRAEALHAPKHRPSQTVFRPLVSDTDWRLAVEMHLACEEKREDPTQRDYLERKMRAVRDVCERGHGAWFGAFRGEEMHCGLGVFGQAAGHARFQSVDTHPEQRRQGLASNLLFAAGSWARSELAATTLVIAAEPEYFAIDIYRSLGFRDHERQVQFLRAKPLTGDGAG
jgi:GNAT superfamily N-acetyltransferase